MKVEIDFDLIEKGYESLYNPNLISILRSTNRSKYRFVVTLSFGIESFYLSESISKTCKIIKNSDISFSELFKIDVEHYKKILNYLNIQTVEDSGGSEFYNIEDAIKYIKFVKENNGYVLEDKIKKYCFGFCYNECNIDCPFYDFMKLEENKKEEI